MRNISSFLVRASMALALLLPFAACGNDNDESADDQPTEVADSATVVVDEQEQAIRGDSIVNTPIGAMPYLPVEKAELPQWLNSMIDEWMDPSYRIFFTKSKPLQVCRTQWQGHQVFYCYPYFSSCLACWFFWEDGTQIDIDAEAEAALFGEENGWACIFLYNF